MPRPTRSALPGRYRATLLVLALCLLPLACGEDEKTAAGPSPEEIIEEALGGVGILVPVNLDTAAIARAVRGGHAVRLPFAEEGGELVQRDVQLTLRNLRAPDLVEFVLKDGVRQKGYTRPLPPPATYQGIVAAQSGGQPGAAVLTITARVVAGNLLVAPDGWSVIEPLEPMLRLRGVDRAQRQIVLAKYNHAVYNVRDTRLGAPISRGRPAAVPTGSGAGDVEQPAMPKVMTIVGDGDAELFRAYPLDSVMPFWLLQETLLNAIDWLYNCVEPEANAENAYTVCGNLFDGGNGAFQARISIDRLETWTTGGPTANNAVRLMEESARFTHQATPVCCGEPHTAGRSNLVHFFTGKSFPGSAGNAAVGGLNVYGNGCAVTGGAFCCHHGVSQVVPGRGTPGILFQSQVLVAHEIGHNVGGAEDHFGFPQDWLFGAQSGSTLMRSGFDGFPSSAIFVYEDAVAKNSIAPLLEERLGAPPDFSATCGAEPEM